MKRALRSFAVCTAAGMVVASLAACGPEKFEPKTAGSETYMEKTKKGEPLYQPPAGFPGVPGGGGSGGGTAPFPGGPPR